MIWVVLYFITVHAPDGQEITLNTNEVSSIRRPREGHEENFAPGTLCILTMTNGKVIQTTETCKEVVQGIKEEDDK